MTVFLTLGIVGLVLVLVALIIGDLLDGIFHLDALDSDLFSVSSLAAFTGAFGFGGALGLSIFDNSTFASIAGLIIGSFATWSAIKLTRFLKAEENTASLRTDSMVGHTGRVITAVPANGYGEIHVTVSGHIQKLSARCATPLEAGTEVWVSSILSPTAVEVTPTKPPHELASYSTQEGV